MGITVFSSLYATRLVLNALGASDFGIFALVAGLISMLVFLNSAMTVSSQRFMSFAKGKNDEDEEKNVFSISVILHILIAFIIVALLESIGPFLFNGLLNIDITRIETAKILYQFMILGTIFTILSVPYDAVINANEDMFFIAILGIFESLLKLFIALYITEIQNDKLMVYGYLMASVIGILLLIKGFYSHKKYKEVHFNIKKHFNKILFKRMYSFAGYTLIGISTQMITSYGQGIVLNIFFGTIVNTAQGIAAQINGQLGAFALTMSKALNPMIVKSEGAGNRELMLKASFIGSRIAFYLLILFYIPVILEMPTIFKYWLVHVPEYTIVFATLLLVRSLIEELYITLSTAIFSVGNVKHFQIYNSVLNLLPLPIAYMFFSFGFKPYIIYIIFIFYALLQGSIYIYFAKKECGMSIRLYFKEVVIKSVIPFILIFAIVSVPHFFILNDFYRLLSVIVVNFVVFSFVIWNIGLSAIEKEFVLQLILRMKKRFTHE
ncbi:MAG: MATE family efflux transporter [Sulfurimonas sp.]